MHDVLTWRTHSTGINDAAAFLKRHYRAGGQAARLQFARCVPSATGASRRKPEQWSCGQERLAPQIHPPAGSAGGAPATHKLAYVNIRSCSLMMRTSHISGVGSVKTLDTLESVDRHWDGQDANPFKQTVSHHHGHQEQPTTLAFAVASWPLTCSMWVMQARGRGRGSSRRHRWWTSQCGVQERGVRTSSSGGSCACSQVVVGRMSSHSTRARATTRSSTWSARTCTTPPPLRLWRLFLWLLTN